MFDILSWNADGTAKLHEQFLDIFASNPLVEPCARTFLGTPLDLSTIAVPNFIAGAINDHLTPWKGTYRTTTLIGGPSTFVLSNAGHIASLVNPPSNPKATYFTGPNNPDADADTWKETAEKRPGSWWEAWADWTIEQSGAQQPASKRLGNEARPALAPAPGLYVRDQLPQ